MSESVVWSKLAVGLVAAAATMCLCGCSGTPGYRLVKEPVGGAIVTGEFPPSLLDSDSDFSWYSRAYGSYATDSARTTAIGKAWNGSNVIVFLGTWCSDSKREVPRFMKILDKAGVGAGAVTLYGLDRMKRSPDGLEQQYRIRLVPTFVFLRDGKEIGRIEERPNRSLEDDMSEILAGSK